MILIHRYIPEKLLPKNVRNGSYEDIALEEFFKLIAKADLLHELAIEDIHAGFLKALNEIIGDN